MARLRALLVWTFLALPGLRAAENNETCCGPVVPRKEWRARQYTCNTKLKLPVPYVVVSHTAGSACDTPALCQQQANNVQYYHMETLKFCDVAYNFLIGEDGLVYEGRGWNNKGDHSGSSWNHMSIGITFMGNYMERLPAPRAIRAAKSLLACGIAQGALMPNYVLRGHRDVQKTLSPGDRLYEIIETWSHYT